MTDKKQILNLFEYLPKSGRKAGEGNGEGEYPFYTSGQVQNKYLNDYDYNGDCLVLGSGGKASIHYATGKFSASNDCFVLKPKGEKQIHSKYVYYYFIGKMYLLENGFRGAGLKHLSRSYFNNLDIPLLPFQDQKRIAEILDKADYLRQKRKESIKLLDDFLRSTFLEMFGDPVVNPKGWEKKTIEELVIKNKYAIKRGPFGGSLKKEIFVKEGYLVYEQHHALNNDFTFGRYFIDEDKFNELKPFEVKEGDILISCSGVYLGKLAIVPKGSKKGVINQALLKISLDQSEMNNHLFWFIFSNPNFKRKYFGSYIGSGIPNFPSMKEFKKFRFIQPPIELQNKFADIIQQVEKLKAKYKESEKELNNLFGSLMQRAFRGEL